MDVHRIQLRVLPADLALRAAGLFLYVFLWTVRASVARVPDPCLFDAQTWGGVAQVESPIPVRYAVPSNRVVQPRIHGRQVCRAPREIGIRRVPGARTRQSQRKSIGVDLVEVYQVLRRLVEAATTEMAAGIWKIQAVANVGIGPVGIAVVSGGLKCPYGLLSVLKCLEPGPDLIEACFQTVGPTVLDVLQRRYPCRKLAGAHLNASFVSLGRPLRRASLVPIPRSRGQQLYC